MATKKKFRGFDEGGDVEVDDGPDMTNDMPESNALPGPDTTAKKQSFGEAFAAARKGGGKTFEYNGKSYTTDAAGSKSAARGAQDNAAESARYAATKPGKKANSTSAAEAIDMAKAALARRRASSASEGAKPSLAGFSGKSQIGMGTMKFAKGGRIDGIAQRGKTRGTSR